MNVFFVIVAPDLKYLFELLRLTQFLSRLVHANDASNRLTYDFLVH